MITREALAGEYLDYRNKYLTVDLFAEHRGLTKDEGEMLLALSRVCFMSKHPEA